MLYFSWSYLVPVASCWVWPKRHAPVGEGRGEKRSHDLFFLIEGSIHFFSFKDRISPGSRSHLLTPPSSGCLVLTAVNIPSLNLPGTEPSSLVGRDRKWGGLLVGRGIKNISCRESVWRKGSWDAETDEGRAEQRRRLMSDHRSGDKGNDLPAPCVSPFGKGYCSAFGEPLTLSLAWWPAVLYCNSPVDNAWGVRKPGITVNSQFLLPKLHEDQLFCLNPWLLPRT